MKKFLASLLCVGMLSFNVSNVSAEKSDEVDQTQKVKLTEDQKEELDTLYQEMLKMKKQIIMKYEEYGVISKEAADKKVKWMENHYEKMKKNGFIPKKRHHQKKYGQDEKTAQ